MCKNLKNLTSRDVLYYLNTIINYRLVKLQRRIYSANLALHYYVTQQWTFKNNNFLELRSKIKSKDKKDFFYELETINQTEYFRNGCIGGKEYILKEKIENLPKARAHLKR